MIPTAAPKRSSTSRKLIFLLLSIAFLWALSTIALFNKLSTRQNQQQFNVNDGREQDANVLRNNKDSDLYNASIFNLKDDLFCKSINEALADGPTNRTMIQTFVSNSGHLSFLYNSLLSMRDSKLPWKSLVLAIGANVCPMIMNFTSSTGIDDNVVCVPYLERLLYQLQRDEPQSLQQIQSALQENNDTSQSVYDHIEKNVFGWGGGVEYKFLINAKLYALRDVLECGSDAFITDTDIAFRQDPRPYFDMGGEEGDIIGQNDTNKDIYLVNMNSGFMYWKRTKKNLDLIDDIIKGEKSRVLFFKTTIIL